jgi:hypothetical protein
MKAFAVCVRHGPCIDRSPPGVANDEVRSSFFFGGGGGLIYLELCLLATHSLRRAAYASAKVLCVSLRQAQRYSSGEAPVPDSIAKLLPALIALGRADVGGPDSRDA